MCGQWWVSARLVSLGLSSAHKRRRMNPAIAAFTLVCSNLHATSSLFTSVSTKMSIMPNNNQKLFMWMSHFCYWFEAVMGCRHWSLRPNAFRKWHFIFNNAFSFFLFSLTTVWNRTVAKLLIILIISFIHWNTHLSLLLRPIIQHVCLCWNNIALINYNINHSEMQQQ